MWFRSKKSHTILISIFLLILQIGSCDASPMKDDAGKDHKMNEELQIKKKVSIGDRLKHSLSELSEVCHSAIQPISRFWYTKILHHKWNYNARDRIGGPENWLKLYAGKNVCGKLQSPIPIHTNEGIVETVELACSPFRLHNYKNTLRGKLLNTGHSVQFAPVSSLSSTELPEIYGGGLDQTYRFLQYHFHWGQTDDEGSEHVIDGQHFPVELHIVHRGVEDPNKLAVLAVFLRLVESSEKDAKNDEEKCKECCVQKELKAFNGADEKIKMVGVQVETSLFTKLPKPSDCICCSPSEQLSGDKEEDKENNEPETEGDTLYAAPFVRYEGSLTTPPLSENVVWTVFLDPVDITREQLEILRSVRDKHRRPIGNNYRPLQDANGRPIILHTTNHS